MAIDLDVHGNTKPLEAAVQAAVNRIRRQPIKITVDDKGATQPLGNMKRGADEFTKSMEAANARILAFGASMAIINGVANAFKGMVKNLVEVEKAMADVNVVMGLSAQNLEKFSDGLFKVAKETGAAFRVAADAATEYARQGLGVEESLKRTRDALVLTRLTGMDSAEAVKSLTAAMNTYGTQIKDTTQLVSKFAAVDVKFAVSAQDFADAISRTGQSAQSAGVSIDELVGIVTAAQQKTARGGAVIGNALKTIFTKTGKTDTLNQLENLGIAVRDLEGNTIGAQRILNDLANTFDTLSAAQKAQITQTMGGLFHINILKAVLSDAAKQNGIMAEATRISAGATDEAIQKNEELRKTMSAVATETGLAIKQVSTQIGEIALAPGMEKILNSVKSLAEGLSGVLGDGESTGSSFATGLLKGIGNVITGPGLVVLAGVFFKLFGQALKFTKESLTSLVGVTTEKQKQKAIQTSLVALFGQNAALNKEMLRTDIGRTEKEKIILGLLRAQVVEASSLNKLTAGMAGTLYRKGYGANLTPVGKKASGHIPNYANPERAQAAQGGYAAGNIRSMNIPGEGSVIYNSAEKVKNFKGMSQPAIMPPHSSKAGKNYQQAFGDIHGFDPYAAGGYIPNYAIGIGRRKVFDKNRGYEEELTLEEAIKRKGVSSKQINEKWGPGASSMSLGFSSNLKAKGNSGLANTPIDLNKIPLTKSKIKDMGVLLGYGPESGTKPVEYRQSFGSLPEGVRKQLLPYMGPKGLRKMPKQDSAHWKRDVKATLPTKAVYAVSEDDVQRMKKVAGEDTLQAALKRSIGPGFDKFSSKIGQKLFGSKSKGTDVLEKHVLSDGSALGALFEAGVRGALNNKELTGAEQQRAFDFMGDNAQRLSDKFMGIGKRYYIEAKKDLGAASRGDIPKKVLNAAAAFIGPMKPGAAGGYIPNFADPLSDAIGREKAAGVPVSQIRVGSHGALMGKGNPLGLGVTNTHDEPNGLRDVFGANGFVPNYAVQPSDFLGVNAPKRSKDFNKLLDRTIQKYKDGLINQEELNRRTKRLSSMFGLQSYATEKVNAATNEQLTTMTKVKAARNRLITGIKNQNRAFAKTGAGRAFGSTGGQMGLMMGLPMAGGFLQDAIGGRTGAVAGGMLSGAGTGASIGMMFGPLGTAIGTTVGALGGLVTAVKDAAEAEKEKAKEVGRGIAAALPQAFYAQTRKNITPQEMSILESELPTTLSKTGEKTVHDVDLQSWGSIDHGSGYSEPLMLKRAEAAKEQGQIISQYLRQTKGKSLYKTIKKDAEGIKFTENLEPMSGDEYEKMLRKSGVFDAKTPQEQAILKEIITNLKNSMAQEVVAQEEKTKAVILQLNLQKAMMVAQKASVNAQFEIKSKFLKHSNLLDSQEKLLGGLMSEEQKVRIKYNKSLLKASEAYEAGTQKAADDLRLGIMQDIAADTDGALQQALKLKLFDKKSVEAGNISKVDLTNKLSTMNAKELLDILKDIGITEESARKIVENKNTLYENTLNTLRKEKNLSNQESRIQSDINTKLAERKSLMEDVNQAMKEYVSKLDYASKLRGISSDLQVARFGAGPVRTQEEIFAEQQRLVGDRQQNIRTEFIKGGLSTMKSIGDKVELTDEQRMQVLQDPSLLNKMSNTFTDQEQKDFTQKHGPRMKVLQAQTAPLMKKIAEGKELGDQEIKQLEEYSRLLELENNLKDAKKEQNEESKRISEELERQIGLKDTQISKEQELLNIQKQEYARKTGPGAFGEGMKDARIEMGKQVKMMDYELGKRIPTAFADGLAGAMTEAINGTKSIKEGLMDAAVGFLGMIQEAMMKKMVYQMVGLPFSQGGSVRNYSRGGGVPAMVTNGEYVMGRDAVNKYGGSFMHGMNAGGSIPGFASGGSVENDLLSKGKIRREGAPGGPAAQGSALAANFGGGRGFDSGRLYQRKAMSGAFYAQSGNVGLGEDTSAIQSILSEEERIRQEAEAKRQAKKAKRRQLLGMAASIGLMWGLGGGFKNLFGQKAGSVGAYATQSGRLADASLYGAGIQAGTHTLAYHGGPIRKYASGGHIAGKSGIDQIPAMLSEGEYVIRASSARQIGKPMLDQINAGKFYDGGAVSEIAGSSETGSTGGNTNNISISINMERGSSNKKEQKENDSSGANPADASNDEKSNSELAERIKQQVVSVIVEEQRPGGLLSD